MKVAEQIFRRIGSVDSNCPSEALDSAGRRLLVDLFPQLLVLQLQRLHLHGQARIAVMHMHMPVDLYCVYMPSIFKKCACVCVYVYLCLNLVH